MDRAIRINISIYQSMTKNSKEKVVYVDQYRMIVGDSHFLLSNGEWVRVNLFNDEEKGETKFN